MPSATDFEDQVQLFLSVVDPSPNDPFPERCILLTRTAPKVKIGRTSKRNTAFQAAESNAYIDCPVMSRDHAEINFDYINRILHVSDHGSLHGTYLNGKLLHAGIPRSLSTEDVFIFGSEIQKGADLFPPCTVKVRNIIFDPISHGKYPVVFRVPDDSDVGAYSEPEVDTDDDDDVQINHSSIILRGNNLRPASFHTGSSSSNIAIDLTSEVTSQKADDDEASVTYVDLTCQPHDNRIDSHQNDNEIHQEAQFREAPNSNTRDAAESEYGGSEIRLSDFEQMDGHSDSASCFDSEAHETDADDSDMSDYEDGPVSDEQLPVNATAYFSNGPPSLPGPQSMLVFNTDPESHLPSSTSVPEHDNVRPVQIINNESSAASMRLPSIFSAVDLFEPVADRPSSSATARQSATAAAELMGISSKPEPFDFFPPIPEAQIQQKQQQLSPQGRLLTDGPQIFRPWRKEHSHMTTPASHETSTYQSESFKGPRDTELAILKRTRLGINDIVDQTPEDEAHSRKRKAADISQLTPEEEITEAEIQASIPRAKTGADRPPDAAEPIERPSAAAANPVSSEPQTKRLRRVVEVFGYAALGGVAVMSALIATAPAL